MEIKDFLPMIGVAVGWFLNEASALGKRSIERKKTLGRAISALYFLCLEMVQIKKAQERFKNDSKDVRQWESCRRRTFEKYTNEDPEFQKAIEFSVSSVAEYYPIQAYALREIISKYNFAKGKSLEHLTGNPDFYVSMLSGYEAGQMFQQNELERIVKFLAFRHSIITWFRIRRHLHDIRKHIPDSDLVFLDQFNSESKKKSKPKESTQKEDMPNK